MSALKWHCHRRRFEIADGEGVVYCHEWKARSGDQGSRRLSEILNEEEARWQAAHLACFKDDEDQGYAWAVERLRTLPGLLEFHFHVADKMWSAGTDLNWFTYEAVKRCWAEAS
ncbi:hypothetical protein [Kineosporia succinea]|uniref:Uncharacterized protein n=1 Tax=Kineosporia succinea TaxID=84632 RepID=A0ABT9PAY3_9ACTN|nr:hypothetical protein [Kineosporia succinea]MDP9829350.1 hypothetical protein [Kineosporia succinea]